MSARETVLVSEVIPTSRDRIYSAWLDSRQHSAFTGEQADIDPNIGGHISTFGGYASGKNLELEPARRIVQTWRSTEFPEGSPDSRLEVTLEDTQGGTLVTVLHTEIPEGQGDRYRDGWVRYYLEPMKRYFAKHSSNGVNHPEATLVEDVAAEVLDSGSDDEDELTDAVAQVAAEEGGAPSPGLGRNDDNLDGVRAGSEGGLEIVEETSLPMTPPAPPGRQSNGRPRPRQASARARSGKPDRKKRVANALAKVGAKPARAAKAASKGKAKAVTVAGRGKPKAKAQSGKLKAKPQAKASAKAAGGKAKMKAKAKAPVKSAGRAKSTAKGKAKGTVKGKAKPARKPARGRR